MADNVHVHRFREELVVRVRRLLRTGTPIVQCAVGGGLAWFLATSVAGHPQPFFAPIAAIISLGVTLGQRMRRGMTLREVSAEARVSLGYISEIERGQKEASSELLASLCTALEVPLSDVLREVSDAVAVEEAAVAAAAATPMIVGSRARTGDVVASAA